MKKILCLVLIPVLLVGILTFDVSASEISSDKNVPSAERINAVCIDGYVPNFPDYEPSRDVSFLQEIVLLLRLSS